MGKTLSRAAQVAWLVAGVALAAPAAKALEVTCSTCVAAIESVDAKVATANNFLSEIQTLLTSINNHAKQISLAVGPPQTTATSGTLAQQADFRNLVALQPKFDGFELAKGTKIDLGDLGQLNENLNEVLAIYRDAAKIKEAVQQGRYLEPIKDIERITRRRNVLFNKSIEQTLGASLYSLNQAPTAKRKELSLDTDRLQALTLQSKAASAAKINMEILNRLNHLIALVAAQNSMQGAAHLKDLGRHIEGTEELTPPPARPGSAQHLFERQR